MKRTLRTTRRLLVAVVALTIAWPALAQADPPPAVAGDDPRFQAAWRLVAERYWDLSHAAVDWDEARISFGERPAEDASAVDAVIEAMYEALGDDHSRYVPTALVAQVRQELGDLPCIGVFGQGGGDAELTERLQAQLPPGLRQAGPVSYGLWEDGVGYLRLADLVQAGTPEGLRQAVSRLEQDGASAIVLDLRGNPGGRLVTMMQAAGVFTSGFLWRALTRWSLPLPYPALGSPQTQLPMAVLIDGDVHSAAEGLAGALQARERALLVGATTAGNVEAILPFCLRGGAQAWIATGVLAPIGGPTWEGRGVVPDLPAGALEAVSAARKALLAAAQP